MKMIVRWNGPYNRLYCRLEEELKLFYNGRFRQRASYEKSQVYCPCPCKLIMLSKKEIKTLAQADVSRSNIGGFLMFVLCLQIPWSST